MFYLQNKPKIFDLKYLLGKVRERVVENILILSLELNVLFAK